MVVCGLALVLLAGAVAAHILFAGSRKLDDTMAIPCQDWTGKNYRKSFYDGWRIHSATDEAKCEHCQVARSNGSVSDCSQYHVTMIYCPSGSLVVASHRDALFDEVVVDRCI